MYADKALLCELDGILYEVIHNLAQTFLVRLELHAVDDLRGVFQLNGTAHLIAISIEQRREELVAVELLTLVGILVRLLVGHTHRGIAAEGYLKSFFKTHKDLSSKEDYEEFAKLVDTDSVRDYFLAQVWINNKWDWPGKNWSMWKTAEVDESNEYADGRWRLMFYDMEFGGVSGQSDAFTNTVKEDNYKRYGLLDMDTNNPAVLCFAYLMTNDEFRADYNEKLLALSSGIYKKETLIAGLDRYESEYGPLYDQFFERYPDTGSADEALNGGYASSKCIRDFVDKREDHIESMVSWINKTLEK